MRVAKKDKYTGKLIIDYPFEVKKVQEGKTPAVAQKKIGSGAWTPAYPQGVTSEQDDEEESKKKDSVQNKVRRYSWFGWVEFKQRRMGCD